MFDMEEIKEYPKSEMRWNVEDMVLEMADIIVEKRRLEREVMELRKFRDEYYKELDERAKASDRATRTMLQALFCGEAIGSGKESDKEFALHFCETGTMDFSKKG